MKLTIRAIIRWEQLNKRPFQRLDYDNDDDVISLFYTCSISDGTHTLLPEFKLKLTEKSIAGMVEEFGRQTSFISQFQAPVKNDTPEASDPAYIKDIIPLLVMNGLDIHFAYDEMELCDLPIYIQAYEDQVKDRMEAQRMGLFWTLRPNLSQKVKSPKDLYTFPWDEFKTKIKTTEQISPEEAKEQFKAFMQSGRKTE